MELAALFFNLKTLQNYMQMWFRGQQRLATQTLKYCKCEQDNPDKEKEVADVLWCN